MAPKCICGHSRRSHPERGSCCTCYRKGQGCISYVWAGLPNAARLAAIRKPRQYDYPSTPDAPR